MGGRTRLKDLPILGMKNIVYGSDLPKEGERGGHCGGRESKITKTGKRGPEKEKKKWSVGRSGELICRAAKGEGGMWREKLVPGGGGGGLRSKKERKGRPGPIHLKKTSNSSPKATPGEKKGVMKLIGKKKRISLLGGEKRMTKKKPEYPGWKKKKKDDV